VNRCLSFLGKQIVGCPIRFAVVRTAACSLRLAARGAGSRAPRPIPHNAKLRSAMQRMLPHASVLLLSSPLCANAATIPSVGTFGFDWLRPKSARCQTISEALLKRFSHCERRPGAFGLSDPVYVCRIDEHSEYMIFESESACVNNLETMKANGP